MSILDHYFFISFLKNWLDGKIINSESISQNHFNFPSSSVKSKLIPASLPCFLSAYLLCLLPVFLPEQAGGAGDRGSNDRQGFGATGGQAVLGRCGFCASQLLIC